MKLEKVTVVHYIYIYIYIYIYSNVELFIPVILQGTGGTLSYPPVTLANQESHRGFIQNNALQR